MGGWPQLRETRTITSGKAPGTVVRCGLRDLLLSKIYVSVVLFYDHPLPEEALAEGLSRALAAVPVFGGRLRTVADGLEIVCGDEGVPLELFTYDVPLAEAIARVIMPNSGLVNHCDATAALTGDAPLVQFRVSSLAGGATAIGASFHHAVGDLQSYLAFLRAWSSAVDGSDEPEATVVEDRDAYVAGILPPGDNGTPSFRLLSPEDRAILDAEVQASARANRIVQVYFTDLEASRMRTAFEAAAGRKLSTNDALAAHIHTTIRDLDTSYEGVRDLCMPVNVRRRLDLPRTFIGNVLGEVHVPCAPDTTPARFAGEIRAVVESSATEPLNYRSDHRLAEEVGLDQLDSCVANGFNPAARTFMLSSWTKAGVHELTFDGHAPILMSPTTGMTLPWTAWLVEGFDNADYLLTVIVPVRLSAKLRGAEGRARLHLYRHDDDTLPALAVESGKLI